MRRFSGNVFISSKYLVVFMYGWPGGLKILLVGKPLYEHETLRSPSSNLGKMLFLSYNYIGKV